MARTNSAKIVDWEKAKALYRTGTISVKEIGRQIGCSDVAILKKAKKEGWERDLAAQVKNAVREKLVREDAKLVRNANPQTAAQTKPQTDEQIVEAAAKSAIEVVRLHRRDLAKGQQLVELLFGHLDEAARNRREIEADITAEMDPLIDDSTGPERQSLIARKVRMLRAIELPTHAGTLRDLSAALKNFQPLERLAWGLNENNDPDSQTDLSLQVTFRDAGAG